MSNEDLLENGDEIGTGSGLEPVKRGTAIEPVIESAERPGKRKKTDSVKGDGNEVKTDAPDIDNGLYIIESSHGIKEELKKKPTSTSIRTGFLSARENAEQRLRISPNRVNSMIIFKAVTIVKKEEVPVIVKEFLIEDL